jgi:hypothetical protein
MGNGIGYGMGFGMGLWWLVIGLIAVLSIAALIKYLRK